MTWDWTALLLLDAALLVLATAVVLAVFVRDLQRSRAADRHGASSRGEPENRR